MPANPSDYLEPVIEIAKNAAKVIMPYHKTKTVTKQFSIKRDQSPVTEADLESNEVIVAGLTSISNYPVLAEESEIPDFAKRRTWETYWLVDPLDGTKDFIAGADGFTVNIALIENHQPILGVIVSPIENSCYYAHRDIASRVRQPDGTDHQIKTASWDKKRNLRIIASRRHDNKDVDHLLLQGVECDITRVGSAIKFCRIAEGAADFYPRFGPTSEWDTAAGQIIVEQAGGKVVDKNHNVLRYNTQESLINPHFIAVGDFNNVEVIL